MIRFESHEDKLLKVHLQETMENAKHRLKSSWDKTAEVACLCHDFGKYTIYFQNRLKYGDRNDERADHSYISALFGAYAGMRLLKEENHVFYVYHAILCHHKSVSSLRDGLLETDKKGVEIPKAFQRKLDIVYQQIEDMKSHKAEILQDYASWNYDRIVEEFLDASDLVNLIRKLGKLAYGIESRFKQNAENYIYFQSLYSALIAGDKFSASNTPMISPCEMPFVTLNESRRISIEKRTEGVISKMGEVREEIFTNIMNSIEAQADRSYLYSITSPTGTGKTYAGFFAAVKLNERLGGGRKIIYALPFTSIINQNFNDIYELYAREISDFEKQSGPYLMKHHSLSDVDYQTENYDVDKQKAEMLRENWTSNVIVTTFVQVLETLIGNRNRMLKKFNEFRHSILILDEVQAIPIELLRVADYVLREAARLLDCKIILMTATRPLLLTEAKELLPEYEKYFRVFCRTKLTYKPGRMTVDEFTEEFLEQVENKSYLIVCNTIQESLLIYNDLKRVLPKQRLFYLSANLLPCDRDERIKEIEKSFATLNPIVISTQVIEAGVNLSFDYVIRDLAPLSSIIQAAGRCNRHGKKALGLVRVVELTNGRKGYGQMIYGNMQINITKQLLEQKQEILESEYLELIHEYFQKINSCVSRDSDNYIRSIQKLVFTDEKYAIDKFHLIEEKGAYVEVYFRIDENAERLYQKFLHAVREKDKKKKYETMLELNPKMSAYTLSIPEKYASRINHVKEEIIWSLPMEGCNANYCRDTGFKRKGEDYLVF